MLMGCIRMDVRSNKGCDCGSVKEYGERMDERGREGGASFIDLMRTVHQQKATRRQIRWCCFLTLIVWSLSPVRPVRPVHWRHIWFRLAPLNTLLSTGFCPHTCN